MVERAVVEEVEEVEEEDIEIVRFNSMKGPEKFSCPKSFQVTSASFFVHHNLLQSWTLRYYNSLVILVLCYSVIAVGVDIVIVIVVVVVVNFRCPPVAIKSWQHNVTWAISVYNSNSNKVHVTQ